MSNYVKFLIEPKPTITLYICCYISNGQNLAIIWYYFLAGSSKERWIHNAMVNSNKFHLMIGLCDQSEWCTKIFVVAIRHHTWSRCELDNYVNILATMSKYFTNIVCIVHEVNIREFRQFRSFSFRIMPPDSMTS